MATNAPKPSIAAQRRADPSNRRVTVKVPGFVRGGCTDGDPAGWLTASFVLDERRPQRIERGGELRHLIISGDDDLVIAGFRAACARAGAPFPEALRCRVVSTIPVAAGCGASAAAVVAGVTGARALLELPVDHATVAELACAIDASTEQVQAAIDGHTVATHITCDDD